MENKTKIVEKLKAPTVVFNLSLKTFHLHPQSIYNLRLARLSFSARQWVPAHLTPPAYCRVNTKWLVGIFSLVFAVNKL